jgi:integrase
MSEIMEFYDRYIAARDVTRAYAGNLRRRIKKLVANAGSESVADVFTEANLNKVLQSLAELSPWTVRHYRGNMLALWNAAADEGLVPYPISRRIRRPKCPAQVVECFSHKEVQRILEASRTCFSYRMRTGVHSRQYWPTLIMLAWDTGLRRGDCWRFRKSWIKPDGSAHIVQSKTGKPTAVRLHAATIAELNKIPFDQACYWSGSIHNGGRFSRQFRDIRDAAGLTHGTFKWLRRSSGSYVELEQPGAGTKHLGHSDARMFAAHYDGKLGGHTAPMPPALELPSKPTPPTGETGDEYLFL